MPKIGELEPEIVEWRDALVLPAYDPSDAANPDPKIGLSTIRTAEAAFENKSLDVLRHAADQVTLSSNAGEVNTPAGIITTEGLTTAAGASQALTITNSLVESTDIVFVQMIGGTNTGGTWIFKAVPSDGSFVITAYNKHAADAFNGTFILGYLIVRPA